MKINSATLLYFTLILIATLLLLPKSLLGFYHVQVFSAIYLPNLKGDAPFIYLPNLTNTPFKSIIAYPIFMQILSILLRGNAIFISNITGIASILSIIFSYILFFRIMDGNHKIKSIASFLYPIILICTNPSSILAGYVLGFSTILCFMISFSFLDERRKSNYISLFFVAFISWITLGLLWHSEYSMIYLILIIYIIISNLYNVSYNKIFSLWNILILYTVSFLFTWFYLRENTINNILNSEQFRSISISSIFNKGSFTGAFTYNHSLQIYLEYVDIIRYLGDLLAYIIMLIFAIEFAINIFRKKNVSKNHMFLTSLFISDILFISIYFISTGTLGTRILSTFSYLLILIMLNSDQQFSIKCLNNSNLRVLITLFLIMPLILTSIFSFYNYLIESPEQNVDIDTYNSSFRWISEYTDSDMINSDAHTSGHYQLFYTLGDVFDKKQMNFNSLSYAKYKKIVDSTYNPSDNSLLVINEILYEKHLQFQTLEAWNTFEPLSSKYLKQNINLNEIYNDGYVSIAQ
ncbi:hypothetical protein [Methanosarcina sp. UBA289]|uniref:hypothetical protein n=1 Tax=Methanosarcina sp. UBA289 TaxID=1915574 RepID=UPI0025EAA9FA|nr:hypothetical protein [Methanosarcina sp. UBA289]